MLDYLDRLFHYCVASDWGRKPVTVHNESSSGDINSRATTGVTVANLVDELLRRKGNCEVSVEDGGPFHLADLHAEICSIDAFLRRAIALRPGQPVAIYRTNDRRCFHWFLAIIRAGGIAVPLNPQLSLAEVRRILADSGTEILVTDKARLRAQHRRPPGVSMCAPGSKPTTRTETLDGFLRVCRRRSSQLRPCHHRSSRDCRHLPYIRHQRISQGCGLSSNALLGARASTVLAGVFLGPRDLALVALPWSHIMAVSIALYGLMAGIRGCFLDRFDVDAALDLIERFGVTAVVGVPAMFARLVNSNPEPRRLASVRVWLSASDHLPSEVRAASATVWSSASVCPADGAFRRSC